MGEDGAMKRLLVVLLMAGGLVLVSPSAALACSCVELTAEQHAKEADTVAVGTVEWVTSNDIETTYGVNVEQVYKGIAGLREKLVTPANGASCGLGELVADERYIFFIDGKHPGQMNVTSCGGTTAYDVAVLDEVQRVTDGPFEPLPAFESGPTAAADSTDWVRVVGIGALLAFAAFGVFVVLRRRAQGHGGRQYLG